MKSVGMSYSAGFYSAIEEGSQRSAQAVLGVLWQHIQFKSVIDVGCGTGAWLLEARALGARKLMGIDGTWARDRVESLGGITFVPMDLNTTLESIGIADVVFCIEVAEHLPAGRADALVDYLCGLSDTVLFSAAVPYQAGTDHQHLQWQSYWLRKFEVRNFVPLAFPRSVLWGASAVCWHYRQNMVLYAKKGAPQTETLEKAFGCVKFDEVDVVHPQMALNLGKEVELLRKELWNPSFTTVMRMICRWLIKRVLKMRRPPVDAER